MLENTKALRLRLAPIPATTVLPARYDWLSEAAKLSGKSLNLALALLWLASVHQVTGVSLTRRVLKAWSISRDARYTALPKLVGAGLVKALQLPGRAPFVILVEPRTDKVLRLTT
jgi:hypothetical protein